MEQMGLLTVERRFKPEQYELARAGYEAHKKWMGGQTLVGGLPLPEFDMLLPKVQDAWAAAGEAMEETIRQRMGDAGELAGAEEEADRAGYDWDLEAEKEAEKAMEDHLYETASLVKNDQV